VAPWRPPSRSAVLVVTGGRPLKGRIPISGSKNASLPILAASLLTRDTVTLRNLPELADTMLMREILANLGVRSRRTAAGAVSIVSGGLSASYVPDELGRRMRASIVLLGALLGRAGRVRVPRPGGDEIGARRVEQHIRGLRQMGATVVETDTEVVAEAGRLHGARVIQDMPTVTGTENIMMAAVLADGRTDIFNAAREPHVQDLARFLNAMGARIRGAGSDEIIVDGVERLHGAEHTIIPDYLEAGTFAIAATAAGGDVRLEGSPPAGELTTVLVKLEQAGAEIEVTDGTIRVHRPPRSWLHPVDLLTWTHPGFPTDLQAQYLAMMTQAHGTTVVSEYLFDNRFQHVPELMRMGARISVEGRSALIQGPTPLHGTDVVIPDIRSGAALVIAALCAQGTTELHEPWHVDRGYQDLVGKLRGVGAMINRAPSGTVPSLPVTRGTYE
jgi:UDP-N-acetylglucosamine 1-carboxyvinyltransferase